MVAMDVIVAIILLLSSLIQSFATGLLFSSLFGYTMNRPMKVLVWNVRGINSQAKWDAIRDKISESSASIVCLQETKRENFSLEYIRNFCPRQMDKFEYFPSNGASGG